MSEPKFHRGDLVIISPYIKGQESTLLGSMTPDRDDDFDIPTGTMCIVDRRLTDKHITSTDAYVVILEAGGRVGEYWLYADELTLVSRGESA